MKYEVSFLSWDSLYFWSGALKGYNVALNGHSRDFHTGRNPQRDQRGITWQQI